MENLDTLIKESIEPYLIQIEQLKEEQKKKEAEIITLKYAILEMDRRYQELEKKFKSQGSTRATTAMRTSSKQATSRTVSQSSTARVSAKNTQQTPRDRSRTPTATKALQNTLNSSRQTQSAVKKETSGTTNNGPSSFSNTQRTNSRQKTDLTAPQKSVRGKLNTGAISSRVNAEEQKSQRRTSTQRNLVQERAHSRQNSQINITSNKNNVSSNLQRSPLRNTSKDSSFNKSVPPPQQSQINSDDIQGLVSFGRFQAQVFPPEILPQREDPQSKPNIDLKLAYVPSYNGKTARNNIEFIDRSNIVFFSSSIVIIMNVETYEQRLLQGHTEEVQCISYCKDHQILVSAQKLNLRERDPYFILWDIASGSRIVQIGAHTNTIHQVGFDEKGHYLFTIGGSIDKITVAIWKVSDLIDIGKKQSPGVTVRDVKPISEYLIGKTVINTLYFDNQHSDDNQINFVLGVEKGIKFFTFKTQEKLIEEKRATISQSEGLKNIYGIAFNNDDTLAAGDNGLIYIFRQDKVCDSKFKADKSSVQCLIYVDKRGQQLLVTINEDEKLTFWDGNQIVEQIQIFDDEIKAELGVENLWFKAKALAYSNGSFVIGFEQNLIIKINQDNKREILIQGPALSPQQVAPFPKGRYFATVGEDKFLRFFSYAAITQKRKHCQINSIELSNAGRSLDFSPNGKYLAVGYDNGIFEVFIVYDNSGEFFQLECLKLFDLSRKFPISCVRFSPNGRLLVITCNKDIVVFNAENDDFEQDGLLKGNSTLVTQLQFDKNSHFAMTNSIDSQSIVWDLRGGQYTRVSAFLVKDSEWDRKCCIYAWDTQGVWQAEHKETDVNSVSISRDRTLLAVGDKLGKTKLFLYPAYLQRQASKTLNGHINHVKCVEFMPDDSYLVTVGEYDCTIMIWAYKEPEFGVLSQDDTSPIAIPVRQEEEEEQVSIDLKRVNKDIDHQ